MKYRLNPANIMKLPRKYAKKLSKYGRNPIFISNSTKKPKPAIDAQIKEYGICCSVMILPSLFTKVFLSIKRVLVAKVTNRGTPIIVPQNIIVSRWGYIGFSKLKKWNARARPKLIPNQKIKFHSLSLLSHLSFFSWITGLLLLAFSLVKSCIRNFYSYFKFPEFIIPQMPLIAKQIISTLSITGLFLMPISSYAEAPETKESMLNIIKQAEKEHTIPPGLLLAVIKTESGVNPYALNINGRPVFLKDKNAALDAINQALASGITNIDIGIAQLNYKWHKSNFPDPESMLLPSANIKYAAKLLAKLKFKHGDWHKAIRHYHSSTPKYHKLYSRKVVLCWLGS